MEKHIEDIRKQIKESYGRLVYTKTVHNKECHILQKKLNRYNCVEVIMSAATTTGVVSAVLAPKFQNIALIFSLVLSTVILMIRFINPNETLVKKIENHKNSANNLWIIKEQYLSLLTDLDYMKIDEVIERRDELLKELNVVYKNAPQTSSIAAYNKAQDSLKNREEQFFTNEELNNMLPEHLRED